MDITTGVPLNNILLQAGSLYSGKPHRTHNHDRQHATMTGILWGLLGAFLIGASDCIARVTSQRVSTSLLILIITGLSALSITVWLAVTGSLPPWHTQAWLASAASGVLNVAALYLLFLALARGPVAMASPAASSFAVILVLLNIATGEQWTVIQLIATLVVFAGVAMLPRHASDENGDYNTAWLQKTAFLGFCAGVTIAFRMYLAQDATAILGATYAVYLNRLFAGFACLLLVIFQMVRQDKLQWPADRSTAALILAQSVLEMAALGAFLTGSTQGGRVTATIGFSAMAAATVIIARVFLHEKIGWWRASWISVIGIGVVAAILGTPSD
ncbi:hypothetical protein AB833_26435 [Chromatiales bacterium (ex Bugula neritina AB1)]|nr:hypothetical protein AB833_26435 [Chromatiales bacterium (ex Bugula neritina AB1)]